MAFMTEGGIFMWLILLAALASAGASIALGKKSERKLCALGALLCVAFGMAGFGMGLGLTMSAAGSVDAASRLSVLMEGMGESSNNLIFGGALGALLTFAAYALDYRKS